MHRSNSNRPFGRRYAQAYAVLEHPYKQLRRTDPKTSKDAIWLFDNSDLVRPWLDALPKNERDRWTHPTTIRRHYEKRHPSLLPVKKPRSKERPPRTAREPDRRPLGELSREDLEACIVDLGNQVADRDREIAELNDQLEERDRTIAQLREDLQWEKIEAAQLRGIVTPPIAAEAVRESREVIPPMQFDRPHYAGWARLMVQAIASAETVTELEWLRDDNREHIAAFEAETPGAGKGIEDRINERITQLQ
jgi:uncharacterized coiled-coil protein SlyX